MKIDGKNNFCDACTTKWCHMCNKNLSTQQGGASLCGWTSQWCFLAHMCRFSVNNNKREENDVCTYLAMIIPLCILYPVWGIFVCLGYSLYSAGNNLFVQPYRNSKCLCFCASLPLLLILFLMFWSVILEGMILFVFIPSIFYAYVVPCAYCAIPVSRA